jgi:hypothetical protein
LLNCNKKGAWVIRISKGGDSVGDIWKCRVCGKKYDDSEDMASERDIGICKECEPDKYEGR